MTEDEEEDESTRIESLAGSRGGILSRNIIRWKWGEDEEEVEAGGGANIRRGEITGGGGGVSGAESLILTKKIFEKAAGS